MLFFKMKESAARSRIKFLGLSISLMDNQTNMIWKVKHYQFATILTTTYWCTKISSMAASTGIFLAWMKTWEQ